MFVIDLFLHFCTVISEISLLINYAKTNKSEMDIVHFPELDIERIRHSFHIRRNKIRSRQMFREKSKI